MNAEIPEHPVLFFHLLNVVCDVFHDLDGNQAVGEIILGGVDFSVGALADHLNQLEAVAGCRQRQEVQVLRDPVVVGRQLGVVRHASSSTTSSSTATSTTSAIVVSAGVEG